MTQYIFRPPTIEEGPAGGHRLFYFYKLTKGIAVVRDNNGYRQVRYPLDEELKFYPEVYLGGREHTVSEATKAALIAGNVGVDESNFTAL